MQAKNQYANEVKTPGYAWVILVVVFLASLAAPLNQAKIPPLMPVIMDAFQLSIGQAGWLMSVFALTGFFLALPTGILLEKWGPKVLGAAALASLALGAGLGALSASAGLLLFSRIIEGVGMGLLAVIAPAAIAMWFPAEKQGTPMGIWATWVPLGSVLVFTLAPAMAADLGWQSVWWFGAGYSLLILVVYVVLMRMPPAMTLENQEQSKKPDLRKAFANRNIWLLGLTFACFILVFMSFGTFYPTFLSEAIGYSLAEAAFITSISTIVVLFSAPLAGLLSDRIGSRRFLFSYPFLLIAVMMVFLFKVADWQIYALMIVLGAVSGAIPTATFAAVPEVMGKPQLAGIGMAIVMMCQNLGMFVGPILFGNLVESLGWVVAGYWLIPVCLLGFWAGWRTKAR